TGAKSRRDGRAPLPGRHLTMSREPDTPRLVGGPYEPPPCQIGTRLHDRLRGDVVVSAISDAPIRWPMGRAGWTGKLAPIVTAELERAIRTESALALRYWWGVGTWLVSRWRKALGVPRMTEGTAGLC